MSNKDSLFKIDMYIADMDRQYYCDHHLRLVRYPHETLEHLMLRLMAFVMFAHRELKFTPYQGAQQEAHLLQVNDMEEIENWIIVGQPGEKLLKRACQKSPKVMVVNADDRLTGNWWQKEQHRLGMLDNLEVVHIPQDQLASLTPMCELNMKWQINILDGEILVHDQHSAILIKPEHLKHLRTAQAA